MRGAAAVILAAALLPALALTASGAQPSVRATATGQLLGGSVGAHGEVRARGTDERRFSGGAETAGAAVDNGEAVARTSTAEGTATGVAVARTVSLLDGRVTAYGVRRVVEATTAGTTARGRIEGLVVDGRRIGTMTSPATVPLDGGDGRVIVNTGSAGLRVVLDEPASGFSAGSDLQVAVASAEVRRVKPRPTATPAPTAAPAPTAPAPRGGGASERGGGGRDAADARREATAKPRKTGLERRPAPKIPTRLTRGGFAFPVYGEASFSDDYGAPRQPVIGTHQGNDIFADFGAPVVAVTDGVISKVGTLDISGNRLWLTSDSGDAFFYAHLSAFSPHAVDGRRVKAGTVLGFVGNTGDAEPTPPHVHFEVHPGGMDEPPVNPYPLLTAWQSRRDVPAGAWLQEYGPDTTARPGALVAVRDFIAE